MIWRHFSFTIIWALIILILYGIPGSNMPSISFWEILGPDKIAHAGVFTVLMCSTTFSVFKQHRFKFLRRHSIRNSAGLCIIYGTTLELIQGTVFSGRHTDVLDILANLTGVVLGVVILKLFFKDILS